MTQKGFNRIAGAIFLVVAVLHALRLLLRWEAVIGGWVVPHWASVVALAVSGALALIAFRLSR